MKITVWGKGPSSKALAKALGVRRNVRTADVAIRYGKIDGAFPRELNTSYAVKSASNKFKSLQVMKAAGISVPPFGRRITDVRVGDFTGVIFSRMFYHSKGTDIITASYSNGRLKDECKTADGHACSLDEFEHTGEYFIQYLKPRAEYRYHVAFGKVILCTKKILTEGETDDTLIRNHQNGKWQQAVCTETPRFSETCIKAVKAHGLDFGAVDFLNVNREAVVLEVNTAPGLQVENRLQAYAKAIKEGIQSNG